jgi:hypothetical protein
VSGQTSQTTWRGADDDDDVGSSVGASGADDDDDDDVASATCTQLVYTHTHTAKPCGFVCILYIHKAKPGGKKDF